MKKTTLCYIEQNGKYLMLHRTKKQNDINFDKWIGIGGKFEDNETDDECMLREVKEETGLTLTSYTKRGVVTFLSDIYPDEEMHLYHSDKFNGTTKECDEGELEWINKDALLSLTLWEGDRIFLELLNSNHPFFLLTLKYSGEKLIDAKLNGKSI